MKSLAEIEKETILNTILELGSVTQAARALSVPKTTIYRKLRSYGIISEGRRIMISHLLHKLKMFRVETNSHSATNI